MTGTRATPRTEHCFRTPAEARDLAARLSRLAPKPPAVELGLFELFMNAIEHGNLAIGHMDKRRLLEEDRLEEEIEARLRQAPYSARTVTVTVSAAQTEIRYRIEDEGTGFDWQALASADGAGLDSLDQEHGRGIMIARQIAFARLDYAGSGNCVTATVLL